MPTVTPTGARGAHSHPTLMTYVDPRHGTTPAADESSLPGTGLNSRFVADHLSDMLAHERGGRRLYVSVAGRTHNALLRDRYQRFGDETLEHVQILEELIVRLGGDPLYVSPAARATEKSNIGLLEATFLLAGSVDLVTQELVMLNAVLLAESVDHANWSCLSRLTGELPAGEIKDAFQEAVDKVEEQEDQHLAWAQEMRCQMVSTLASDRTLNAGASDPDDLVPLIEGLFT